MHQRRAIRAEFAFGPVQPQHRLALALRDRLARLPAIDIFPRRIDRARPALGLLPIVLKRPPALILRFVDLAMRVQAGERIVADRAQRDDLVAGSSARGSSTSTAATSALRGRSCDRRSCAFAGLYGFLRLAGILCSIDEFVSISSLKKLSPHPTSLSGAVLDGSLRRNDGVARQMKMRRAIA